MGSRKHQSLPIPTADDRPRFVVVVVAATVPGHIVPAVVGVIARIDVAVDPLPKVPVVVLLQATRLINDSNLDYCCLVIDRVAAMWRMEARVGGCAT